jgi:hypothetical protein
MMLIEGSIPRNGKSIAQQTYQNNMNASQKSSHQGKLAKLFFFFVFPGTNEILIDGPIPSNGKSIEQHTYQINMNASQKSLY